MTEKPQTTLGVVGVVTAALMLINIGVYLYQGFRGIPWINPSPEQQIAWGGNLAMLTLTGDVWRLGTNIFVHGGLMHLLMNMYMLLLIGSLAEREFGRVGMLLVYLAGGVAASCASAWWLGSHSVGADHLGRPVARLVVSVGASGAIMAIAGALLAAVTLRAWLSDDYSQSDSGFGKALGQVVVINIGMGFLMPGVDNAAHLGGLAAGMVVGASVQSAAQFVGPFVAGVVRLTSPVLLGAACALALLHVGDWSDLDELRAQYDEEKKVEEEVATKQSKAEARKLAAEQERQQLPAPVDDTVARGQVIEFGDSGTSFALSTDRKIAYAVDHRKNEISVIDLTRGVVERKIAGPTVSPEKLEGEYCMDIFCGGPAAADIALLRHKPIALVSSMQKDSVAFIDLASGRTVHIVAVGKSPNAILVSADDKRAYVHNVRGDSISVIDVATRTVVHTFALPSQYWPRHKPGERLPMWLNADGSRLFAAATDRNAQQVHAFDTVALASLGAKDPEYRIQAAITLLSGANEVAALADDGFFITDETGAKTKVVSAFCPDIQSTEFAVMYTKDKLPYVAVSDYRGYDSKDSTVRLANVQTGVTIGRYPISGIAMKLVLSDDGANVYVVTNGGRFVVLDTRQRMAPNEKNELLCDRRG